MAILFAAPAAKVKPRVKVATYGGFGNTMCPARGNDLPAPNRAEVVAKIG